MSVPRGSEAELLAELAAIYADADAVYAGSSCPSSSECCRFSVTGREPYVTSLELRAVTRAVARRGGPLSARRRALPLTSGDDPKRICPLLDRDGRCSVYADRPLGCRTFYCERASIAQEPPRDALRELVRRVQEVAARHRPGGDRSQALLRALASARD